MWVVLVYKPGVTAPVVLGQFREDAGADRWARRIRESYPDLDACVEWVYSVTFREPLEEALADLLDTQPRVFFVD